ncbi:MAG TPA: arginine--tRNA ligase [Candidatus Krumholzibacteria bacterium]|nr:arginine--tRNA ligase [Candidatus Krumholzibacteria bacterium]HRX51091.1 arginine--tRNA ligase [Candidatus Krumholzibacteria bacterium]
MTIHDLIRSEILRCLEEYGLFEGDLDVGLEKPRDKSHGDLSSNVAMACAKRLKRNPRELAGELAAKLSFDRDVIESVEIAGPGFINFRLARAHTRDLLLDLWQGQGAIQEIRTGGGKRINVEYISANPTGPLNVVSARAGAFGSTLVKLLDAVGYDAHAEYYVNDAGRQVTLLGYSLRARLMEMLGREAEFPEGGYKGRYVTRMAEELLNLDSKAIQAQAGVFNDESFQRVTAPAGNADDWLQLPEAESARCFSKYALMKILTWQRQTCRRFGLRFDTWYFESELHETKRVERALEKLKQSGHVDEREGALWFRSTDFEDDKDRVVVRSDGNPTYFLADVAYHFHKFQRGFERAIDFLGPDHHGHIPRMEAAMKALGVPDGWLEVQILQQVNFVEDGRPMDMSKREGQFVTMDALGDDVGADVAKYIFLTRKPNSHLDFDLDLAREQSSENPVYYVKYAHARICSVLRKAEEAGKAETDVTAEGLAALAEEQEWALAGELIRLPEIIAGAAAAREPHRLTQYAQEIAGLYHQFYHNCMILGDDPKVTRARLQLCLATRKVLADVLELLGVEAPDFMGEKE